MFSPRVALVGALSGAATVALATVLAMPAAAASPTSADCLAAQQTLLTAKIQLQKDENVLSADQAAGVANSKILSDKQIVSQDKATVTVDQTAVDLQCGTVTPTPTPTPMPGPVGLPRNLNCTQLAARGIHDIPASSVWYRPALDANNDGIGCETNLNTFRVVNGQKCHLVDGAWIPVTVAAPPTCTSCSAAAPPPVIYQPPVTVPGPVIQGQPTYVPGPIVSVPNTSQGVNNGDGSTDIVITVDLGNILS